MNDSSTAMIVDQNYWDNSYANYHFRPLPENDPTLAIIRRFIPSAKHSEHAFEAGCFPGRYLVELGKLGYTLNGCDLNERVSTDLAEWCRQNGCSVGALEQKSFSSFASKQYDLVCSFGFIEHFTNYSEVFFQHCTMVQDGGYLVLQFPNFQGKVQRLLHTFFDQDNLDNHVIESMSLNHYKTILPDNFEIVFCEYYGNFDFWIDDFKRKNGVMKKILLKLFFLTRNIWSIFPASQTYSPYGMLIAKKTDK